MSPYQLNNEKNDNSFLEKRLSLSEYEKEQDALANDPSIIRQAGKVPFSAWFIIVTELCERFSYYGASLIFQTYMLGELGLSKSSATGINRGFTFFCYFTAIVGAVLADTKFGKFKTIAFFSGVYFVGLILLTLSAMPFSVERGFGLTGFIISTYVFIASGTGGIKSNVSAFAAEQVREGIHPTETPGVYEDSRITVESVFRYFYWAINVGALFGQAICPVVSHEVSFSLAFAIPAVMFLVGTFIFVMGRNRYVARKPDGSIITKVWNCMRYAMKNKQPGQQHWLDASKGLKGNNQWDDRFVDDLKRTLKACQVFLFYPVYWALYGNMSDNFINQGVNMERPSWLGPEQLNLINSLVLVITIPLFDSYIFPFFRNRGYRLGPIIRITIGFIICMLGFIYVTGLQIALYNSPPWYNFTDLTGLPKGKDPVNHLSVWWQIPPYVVIAISEIFASATGLEFAFKEAAPELKSIVMALFLLTNCGGSLIGMGLAPLSNDPYFVILFAVQTAVLAVITVIFYFLFRRIDDNE